MAFWGLQLETCDLTGLKDFYVNRLNLTFLKESADSLDVQVGKSKLVFAKRDYATQPVYRFTMGILQQHFAEVVNRLTSRLQLLAHEGKTVFDLPTQDTQAVYAFDPVGNLIEFASWPVTDADVSPIWGISQVTLPVDDLGPASNYLFAYLELPPQARITAGDAVVMGNSTYGFRFIKTGSLGFPGDRQAEIHPLISAVPSSINATIKVLDHPYYVHRAKV